MENRIPLPTDNVFKFYALFGLLLVMFGFGSTLYVNNSINELVFEVAVEYETLKADSVRSVSEETRFLVLKRKLEIAKSDKNFYLICIGLIIGLGAIMVWYGFRKWHTEIQPIQDEMARLTLEKLKRELDDGSAPIRYF